MLALPSRHKAANPARHPGATALVFQRSRKLESPFKAFVFPALYHQDPIQPLVCHQEEIFWEVQSGDLRFLDAHQSMSGLSGFRSNTPPKRTVPRWLLRAFLATCLHPRIAIFADICEFFLEGGLVGPELVRRDLRNCVRTVHFHHRIEYTSREQPSHH